MLSRCAECDGKKHIVAFGGLKKDCTACKGKGWTNVGDALKVRGRRKRVTDDTVG